MRQRLFIFGGVFLVILALLVINAVSYVKISSKPETEYAPDRSTYNAGPTGTRAFYDFLQEGGQRVLRWQQPVAALNNTNNASAPSVFVIVGPLSKRFEEEEIHDLLLWVRRGGHLVILDRQPDQGLLPRSAKWQINLLPAHFVSLSPDDPNAVIAGVKLIRPAQPTLLVDRVNNVQLSRLSSAIYFDRTDDSTETTTISADPGSHRDEPDGSEDDPSAKEDPGANAPIMAAPVVHLVQDGHAVLIDYQVGAGRIVLLADPYVVTNAGIPLADNLLLARDLVATPGSIAFDEFHQGRAVSGNQVAAYFAGTPVLPILAQLAIIIVAIMWTRSRRFARALPLVQTDRRSKLEYVASMAELQQRARAYDLAIENIYQRTRRVLARYAGVDSNTPRAEIAKRVAARSKLDQNQVETVMRQCEDSINGEPTSAKQALSLVARLREIEDSLGLRLRQREVKQAREL